MKLYKEALIEYTEKAEALPLWTTARIERHPRDGFPMIAMRIVRGWRNRDLVDGRIPHADMIGWTALVPIEAEEHTERHWCSFKCAGPHNDTRTVYLTPWEPA